MHRQLKKQQEGVHRLAFSFVCIGLFTFWRKIYIAQLVSYIYILYYPNI